MKCLKIAVDSLKDNGWWLFMRWVRSGVIVLLAMCLLGFTGASNLDEINELKRTTELKVALLDAGPIGDHGYTYEGHMGATKMAKKLPYVNLSERENAAGPNTSQIMREYADDGYKVIFCHGEEFVDAIREVAPDYSDTIFILEDNQDPEKLAINAGSYFVESYEVQYLMGLVAGKMTKANKIAFINSIPQAETAIYVDAFARGVASANPEAKVYVSWIGSWYDPEKEKQASLSLINEGCDIITHTTDSDAVGEAAEETGTYYLSYGSNTARFFPHVFLTGFIYNWEPVMTDIVESVHNGTWASHPKHEWWYGLAEDGAELAPFSYLVPSDVRVLVEAKQKAIMQKELAIFPGMSDEDRQKAYYLEPNVVGDLP
jgi:basic membrane lipoprotein Med (substrate-binding protein (PBP1-ABC) superfamily)